MMKKILITLIIITFIVWLSQEYFSITLPKQESIRYDKKEQGISSKFLPTQNENVVVTKKENELQVLTLLEILGEGRFYDAMAYYLENTTDSNLNEIENYLANLAKKNPSQALEYMHAFLDSVPESTVLKLIIHTYISEKNYVKAIEYIIQAKENYVSQSKDTRLKIQLKDLAITYIDTLVQRKEYAILIAFLEDMIAYDSNDSYYSYRLAKLYMKLNKVDEAGALLDTLQYDEVYAQNVKNMLNGIDKTEEEAYEYSIPLQRYADHYTAYVFLDGVGFNLMLDTGATYIFIDEEKASVLSLMGDNILLQTAGNDIKAKRAHVSNLKVGNVEMSNITVTIAPFKKEGIDGLLGMNFFKQFTFFINQEESMLYLNPKN